AVREIVRHPGAVAILPVLEGETRRVVMIRNYRPSVGASIWELPAGTLEPGEEPAGAAARELIEETGYRAARLRPLCRLLTSPGLTDEEMHIYFATGLEHVGQNLDEGEHIEVEPVTIDAVRRMVTDGSIRDGKSLAGLMLADRLGWLDGSEGGGA
ncbi:MAG: NUDIX hydrolase, partial [Phycisphaerales bacterium]|nr:NUDIX hydrolase [Phycisphaerales bacterium]